MLKAVFYARFHPERGPSVIHQYPKGSILSVERQPLISWSDVSSYIIPPYNLCNQSLSICSDGYRILAHPVSLEDAKYDRNRFTFNVGFVLSEDEDAVPWEAAVRKTARFLIGLEEGDGLLQREENLSGLKWAGEEGYPVENVGIIHGLLRDVLEDLNDYGETCVRIDRVHILNLRLKYDRDLPPKVHAWDVPLLIRSLPPPAEWTWDLTLQRTHSYMDGIRHVQRIAELADAEVKLVKRAVSELVHHGHAMLLDIFHFQAIYTCTDDVASLVLDKDVQEECRRYVAIQQPKDNTQTGGTRTVDDPTTSAPSPRDIVELYRSLQPGLQLTEFCLLHKEKLSNLDIRRFITFGVIKGILRRVHKYALATDPQVSSPVLSKKKPSGPTATSTSHPKSNEDVVREFDRAWRRAALSSGWATPPSGPPPESLSKSHRSADRVRWEEDEQLRGYLDGTHCMDRICVETHLSERKIVQRLRSGRFGEVVLFNK